MGAPRRRRDRDPGQYRGQLRAAGARALAGGRRSPRRARAAAVRGPGRRRPSGGDRRRGRARRGAYRLCLHPARRSRHRRRGLLPGEHHGRRRSLAGDARRVRRHRRAADAALARRARCGRGRGRRHPRAPVGGGPGGAGHGRLVGDGDLPARRGSSGAGHRAPPAGRARRCLHARKRGRRARQRGPSRRGGAPVRAGARAGSRLPRAAVLGRARGGSVRRSRARRRRRASGDRRAAGGHCSSGCPPTWPPRRRPCWRGCGPTGEPPPRRRAVTASA